MLLTCSGSTGNPFSALEYRLPGSLRCYGAYTTCEEVKAAGLPSGVYRLDPDGPDGDKRPFPVECFIDDEEILGTIYHDQPKEVSSRAVITETSFLLAVLCVHYLRQDKY